MIFRIFGREKAQGPQKSENGFLGYFQPLRPGAPDELRTAPVPAARAFGKSVRERTGKSAPQNGPPGGQQHPLKVYDQDNTVLGDYLADLLVEEQLVVELKACAALTSEHVAQLLGYLRSARMEHGLLINFGAPKLQIRKYILSETNI
jgi:GxxExxY protein